MPGGDLAFGREKRRRKETKTESVLMSSHGGSQHAQKHHVLGVPSPFFPGILLFRKPSKTQGKQLVVEKNDG